MDAGNDADIDAAFARYAESFDQMHFLVHSIAFADREWLSPGKFIDTPRQAFLTAIDISAYSLAAMARRARPIMARSGGGAIMCMSYYGGEKVVPGYNVMGVAKSALETTARYLSWELGPDKIRVNIISGGYLRTLASSAVGGTDSMLEHVAQRAPLRRNVGCAQRWRRRCQRTTAARRPRLSTQTQRWSRRPSRWWSRFPGGP